MLVVANVENFKFRVSPDLKKRWLAFCETKRISQRDAIVATVEFLLAQDEVIQSMLLGQVQSSPDLIELVLRRLAKPRKT